MLSDMCNFSYDNNKQVDPLFTENSKCCSILYLDRMWRERELQLIQKSMVLKKVRPDSPDFICYEDVSDQDMIISGLRRDLCTQRMFSIQPSVKPINCDYTRSDLSLEKLILFFCANEKNIMERHEMCNAWDDVSKRFGYIMHNKDKLKFLSDELSMKLYIVFHY
jgi:hypothetical protein